MDIQAVFEKYEDEFLEFERIIEPRHRRPDLCAFLMLDDVRPNAGRDMVMAAEHGEIWLDVAEEKLEILTHMPDLVRDLVRCGVRYDEENDCLAMFV